MIATLLLQIKVFLFIMSLFVLLGSMFHIVSVFRLKSGKLISSDKGLVMFGIAIAYILTMLITGF
jgi:hypothetical protein